MPEQAEPTLEGTPVTQLPEWHIHPERWGPTQGHWHTGGDRPHQHTRVSAWGPPEFLRDES